MKMNRKILLIVGFVFTLFGQSFGQITLSSPLAGVASITLNPKYVARKFEKVFFYSDMDFLSNDWQNKIIIDFREGGLRLENIKPLLSPLKQYTIDDLRKIVTQEGGDGLLILSEKHSDKEYATGLLSHSASRVKEYLSLILVDIKLDDYAFSAELRSRRGGSADSAERVVRRTVLLVAEEGLKKSLFLR